MLERRGIFVAGTGTGVGKTVVGAALLALLRAAGLDAVPMKPIQTGCEQKKGRFVAPDLEFALAISGLAPADAEKDLMTPYAFEPACSPHLAAKRAGVAISLRKIGECCRLLLARHDFVVVEGAGGILAPLSDTATMLDLMHAIEMPVVLVSYSGLGAINHTLLSLRELSRAGVTTLGVVFSDPGREPWGEVEFDNVTTIERMGQTPVLGVVQPVRNLSRGGIAAAVFVEQVSRDLPSGAELLTRIRALN